MLSGLLMLFALGIAGLVVAAVVMALIGIVFSITFGIVGFLLFKVAPILLIGWIVMKLIQRRRSPHGRISAADQRWLDSGE